MSYHEAIGKLRITRRAYLTYKFNVFHNLQAKENDVIINIPT